MSVHGQRVVRTCQSGSLKCHKYQDIESEVEGKTEKMVGKKLVRTTVSSREVGHRRMDEGKTTSRHICTSTQRNNTSKSEGGGRQKLEHADGDFPLCMRRESGDNETKMSENEDPKARGGDRLKFRFVDGDVPLSMRRFDEEYKDSSSIEKDNKNKTVSGSNDSSSRKEDSRSKTASGSKDLCGDNTRKKNKESGKTEQKDTSFIVLQKKT